MTHRILRLLSSTLVVGALAATPALATDDPPAPLQPAPPLGSLAPVLGKCSDSARPSSGVGAIKRHVLRGTARDVGCGVAMVTVSFARQSGGRCRFLTTKRKLSRPTRCSGHFLVATGTKSWRLELPKRLSRGTYVVRTRAIDFAGNVETRQAHARRLRMH